MPCDAPCHCERKCQKTEHQQAAVAKRSVRLGKDVCGGNPGQNRPARALHGSHRKQPLLAVRTGGQGRFGLRGLHQVCHRAWDRYPHPVGALLGAHHDPAIAVHHDHQRPLRHARKKPLPQGLQVHGQADNSGGLAPCVFDRIEQACNPPARQRAERNPTHGHAIGGAGLQKAGHSTQLFVADFLRKERAIVAPGQVLHHQVGELGVQADELGDDGVAGTRIKLHDFGAPGDPLQHGFMVAQQVVKTGCGVLCKDAHPPVGEIARLLPVMKQVKKQHPQHRQKRCSQQQQELRPDRQAVNTPHVLSPPANMPGPPHAQTRDARAHASPDPRPEYARSNPQRGNGAAPVEWDTKDASAFMSSSDNCSS